MSVASSSGGPEGAADRIRRLRRRLGVSQERLAVLLGVSFASVNRWERGAVTPSRGILARLAALEAGDHPPDPPSTRRRGRPVRLERVEGTPLGARIPTPATSLIGRSREIGDLGELVGRHGVVTLLGTGGSGKTRLAIEVARQRDATTRGRRWWVGLGPLTDARRVAELVATALEVRERAGEGVAASIARAIGTAPALLVLDNAEHVVEDVATLVAALRDSCPALHVLVTSQVPLGLDGERRVPIPPLDEAAVELFIDRARSHHPSFAPTASETATIAQLCRRLDGLPLAIELAAAWIPTLAVDEILHRLDDRFRLLVGGTASGPARHRTLRATVAWSRERLTPEDAHRLDRLGVFAGAFDLDAADAVAGTHERPMIETIRALVTASLLVTESSALGTRYRSLETVRHFSLAQLAERGELREVAERHARHHLALLEAAAPRLLGAELAATMQRIGSIEDDVRLALRWAWQPEAGDDPDPTGLGIRMVVAIGRYWYITGRLAEGLEWIERFAVPERADVDPDRSRLRADGLYHGAMLAAEAGRYELAAAWGATAEGLYVGAADQRGAARAMTVQGSAAKYAGDLDRAEERYRAALDIARGLDDRVGMAVALNNLGVLATESGAYKVAFARLSESVELKRESGDERGLAVGLMNLGDVAALQGDLDAAERLAQESLERFRALGDRRGMAFATNNLGEAARARGRHREAATWFADALQLFREVGDLRDVALGLVNLGRERIGLGDPTDGRTLLVEGLSLARRLGDRRRIDEALAALALDGRGAAREGQVPGRPDEPAGDAASSLTPREREVLAELAGGRSNKEIAAALGIEASTVERHVTNTYRKLGLAGRVEATAWAIRHGLVSG